MTWPGVIQLARGGDNLPHKCTSTKLAFCTTPLVNSCPLRMYACPLTKCGYLFVFSSLGWVWCDEQSFLSLSFMSLYTSWEKCSPTRSSFARWVGLLSMCCFMQANPPPPKQTDRIIESKWDAFFSLIYVFVNYHWLKIPKKHTDRHPFRDV